LYVLRIFGRSDTFFILYVLRILFRYILHQVDDSVLDWNVPT
jgi:hypothetical protein